MNHQRLATIEVGQKIFRAPPQFFDFPARQPLGEMGRKGPAQIAATRRHLL